MRCVVVAFEGEAAEASSGGFGGGGVWVVGRGEGVGHLGGERLWGGDGLDGMDGM